MRVQLEIERLTLELNEIRSKANLNPVTPHDLVIAKQLTSHLSQWNGFAESIEINVIENGTVLPGAVLSIRQLERRKKEEPQDIDDTTIL